MPLTLSAFINDTISEREIGQLQLPDSVIMDERMNGPRRPPSLGVNKEPCNHSHFLLHLVNSSGQVETSIQGAEKGMGISKTDPSGEWLCSAGWVQGLGGHG